jgi:DNA-binding PadR family transcriptional regulator
MAFRTDQEALVLGALASGPQHGYGIVKSLRDGSSGLFNVNEGQLYPLLHKMQESGWIKGEWETSESGPARKTYVLLDEGRAELQRRQELWRKFSSAVGGLLFTEDKNPKVQPGSLEVNNA